MTQNTKMYTNPVVRYKGVIVFCMIFLTSCLITLFLFPVEQTVVAEPTVYTTESEPIASENVPVAVSAIEENIKSETAILSDADFISYKTAVLEYGEKTDIGLDLYRASYSRPAVEWFFTNLTESRDVALAILQEADKNDIPLSLAFALAYTESRYKVRAYNKNTNSSIDRGLLQLNSSSFPFLTEEEFFDPQISAKYGLSHLRYCLDTAGNEVSALAMYNAGTNRVRNNGTPKMTLDYISSIVTYQQGLERLFNSEVAQYYVNNVDTRLAMEK